MKMNVLPATLVFASLALSVSAYADVADYMKAAGAFCDKLKVCISQEMEKEMGGEVPPGLTTDLNPPTAEGNAPNPESTPSSDTAPEVK